MTVGDGWFLKLGDRLYQVDQPSLGAGSPALTFRVVPYGLALRRSDVVGAAVTPADEIEAHAAGPIESPRDPSFAGPWVIGWEESV